MICRCRPHKIANANNIKKKPDEQGFLPETSLPEVDDGCGGDVGGDVGGEADAGDSVIGEP